MADMTNNISALQEEVKRLTQSQADDHRRFREFEADVATALSRWSTSLTQVQEHNLILSREIEELKRRLTVGKAVSPRSSSFAVIGPIIPPYQHG